MAHDDIFHKMKGGSVIKSVGYMDTPEGKKHAKSKALAKKKEGGMYGEAAMKRFTANKERKHKQWDKEGK